MTSPGRHSGRQDAWHYRAAERRICDGSGLKVAENVLPDDARRILSMEAALRSIRRPGHTREYTQLLAGVALDGRWPDLPGFEDPTRPRLMIPDLPTSFRHTGAEVIAIGGKFNAPTFIDEEDQVSLLNDFQLAIEETRAAANEALANSIGRTAVSLIMARMLATMARRKAETRG